MTSQWVSHSGNVYDNVQDLPKKFQNIMTSQWVSHSGNVHLYPVQ